MKGSVTVRMAAPAEKIWDLIAADWPVMGAPDCPILLDAAQNAVTQARQLDPLLRQALESATRSYCLT